MYPEEMKGRVCAEIAKVGSLRRVCRMEGMPDRRTVMRWLDEDTVFAAEYARAKQVGIEDFIEETLDLADTPEEGVEVSDGPLGRTVKTGDMLGHRKLQVETRRWLAERMLPKLYGPKTGLELSGQLETKSMDATARAARVAALMALAANRKDDPPADDLSAFA